METKEKTSITVEATISAPVEAEKTNPIEMQRRLASQIRQF